MSTSASFLLPSFAPPLAVSTTGLIYQPNHCEDAKSLLLKQFDDAVKLRALLCAAVEPMQEFEQSAFGVLGAFDVETSTGVHLDVLGLFVGQRREERSDVAYRAYVKARIFANASDGGTDTMYRIARALLGTNTIKLKITPWFTESHPAHFDIDVHATALRFPWDTQGRETPDTVARALADALFIATSAGVSFTLFYQYTDDFNAFTFSSVGDAEEDSETQGLADVSDESVQGGALIGAEERF